MRSELCFGIASKNARLATAARQAGDAATEIVFPANAIGLEAIKIALADYNEPVRVAVAGPDAITLALALKNGPRREIIIVSSAVADEPGALLRYASRMS